MEMDLFGPGGHGRQREATGDNDAASEKARNAFLKPTRDNGRQREATGQ